MEGIETARASASDAAILGGHPGPAARRLLALAAASTGSAVIRDTIAATAR